MRVRGFQFDKHLKPPNQRTQQMDTAVFSANSQTGVFDRLLALKFPKDHWIHRNLDAWPYSVSKLVDNNSGRSDFSGHLTSSADSEKDDE